MPESLPHHGLIKLTKFRLLLAMQSRLLILTHPIPGGHFKPFSKEQVSRLMPFEGGEELEQVNEPSPWLRRAFVLRPCKGSHLLLHRRPIEEALGPLCVPRGKRAVNLCHSRATVAPTALRSLRQKQTSSRHRLYECWLYAMMTMDDLW